MKVSVKIARNGVVRCWRSISQARDSQMLKTVHAEASTIATKNADRLLAASQFVVCSRGDGAVLDDIPESSCLAYRPLKLISLGVLYFGHQNFSTCLAFISLYVAVNQHRYFETTIRCDGA